MLKIKTFGWLKKNLDQLSRLNQGFLENGHILTDTNVDFIYCHDGSAYDIAIQYHEYCKKEGWNTKLLLKILDVPEHLLKIGLYDIDKIKNKLLKADLILSNSQAVTNQVLKYFNLSSIPVYDCIKDVRYLPHIQKTFSFLMVGRVGDHNKRAYLAKELIDLPENRDKKLVGCGSENFNFDSSNIYNMGILDDNGLETLYNNAKITLCLSKNEGLLLVNLESFCCGTPVVVCSDMTTAFEFTPKEFICEPNVNSISEKVREIESNYKKYQKLAMDYGENIVKYKFNKKQIAQNIINSYLNIK